MLSLHSRTQYAPAYPSLCSIVVWVIHGSGGWKGICCTIVVVASWRGYLVVGCLGWGTLKGSVADAKNLCTYRTHCVGKRGMFVAQRDFLFTSQLGKV
jgi:hypothetical protein